MSAAKILPVLDGLIILLSVWIFGLNISLYAVISVILSGRIADGLIGTFRNAYLAYIISDHYKEIGERILTDLDRGTTLLPGNGMYTGSDRPVLFCAVSRKQAVTLKELVYETDPQAFVILTDASEIRGEGFMQYSKESSTEIPKRCKDGHTQSSLYKAGIPMPLANVSTAQYHNDCGVSLCTRIVRFGVL